MDNLIVVKTLRSLLDSAKALVKHILLLLIKVDCRCAPLSLVSSLCPYCLTRYNTKLITLRASRIRSHSANSADVSGLLSSVSTSWLIRSSSLTNKTADTYRSRSIHVVFNIRSYCLLVLAQTARGYLLLRKNYSLFLTVCDCLLLHNWYRSCCLREDSSTDCSIVLLTFAHLQTSLARRYLSFDHSNWSRVVV